MLLALMTAQRSPDPNTQVGACIVNSRNQVLGVGYNGLPRGIEPNWISWKREEKDPLQTKYPYIVHAEKNAIYNTGNIVTLEGATLYVTMAPCNECAKDIIQAGIKRIWYLTNPYENTWQQEASRWLLDKVGIRYNQFQWSVDNIQERIQTAFADTLSKTTEG